MAESLQPETEQSGLAWPADHIYVADSRFGRGVFARRPIQKNEQILGFTGPLVSLEDVLRKPVDQHTHPLQVDNSQYMDIGEPGVLVNHSCAPNAGIVEDRLLFALRDILTGEEINYDYSTTMDEDDWTMVCRCGNENCRGVVEDFKRLPMELQRIYLDLAIVQSFIVRRAMAVMVAAE